MASFSVSNNFNSDFSLSTSYSTSYRFYKSVSGRKWWKRRLRIPENEANRPLSEPIRPEHDISAAFYEDPIEQYADLPSPSSYGSLSGAINNESQNEDVKVEFSLWNVSRRQKTIMFCLGMIELITNTSLAVLSPIFPDELEKKGVSPIISGWIFGIFALVQCVTSPIFGKILPSCGSRRMLILGLLFGGLCTIAFGTLQFIPNDKTNAFIGSCFSVRSLLAIGYTALSTACCAVTAISFPENVSTAFGWLEIFAGVGMVLGPLFGGVLYESVGFFLPFVLLGILMALLVPLVWCILPLEPDNLPISRSISVRSLLLEPAITMTCLSVAGVSLVLGVLDPILQPQLETMNLPASIIGLIFTLNAIVYAVMSPVWGRVADKTNDSTILLIIGFLGFGFSFLLLGQSPLLGFSSSNERPWLYIFSMILLGIFSSLALVPTFDKILDSAFQAGLTQNVGAYGVIAGLWGAFYAFGEFVGNSVSGMLVNSIGFSWTLTICTGISFLMAFGMIGLKLCGKRNNSYQNEDTTQPNHVTREPDSSTETDALLIHASQTSIEHQRYMSEDIVAL